MGIVIILACGWSENCINLGRTCETEQNHIRCKCNSGVRHSLGLNVWLFIQKYDNSGVYVWLSDFRKLAMLLRITLDKIIPNLVANFRSKAPCIHSIESWCDYISVRIPTAVYKGSCKILPGQPVTAPFFHTVRSANVVIQNYTDTGPPCQWAYQSRFNPAVKYRGLTRRQRNSKICSFYTAVISLAPAL